MSDGDAELAARRETAKSYGACMSCFDRAPEPFGCTDCLNTGYEGGAPLGYVSEDTYNEARLAAAKAMRERCSALRPSVGTAILSATTLTGAFSEGFRLALRMYADAIAALPLEEK